MAEISDPTTFIGSRPFLSGVDDDDGARRILNSETPQEYLHAKLVSDPLETIPHGLIVRRMDDARFIAKSREAPQTPPGMANIMGPRVLIPIALDGADHTMWRKVLDPVFSPKKMAPLEAAVRRRADELIETFIDRGSADVYDEWCELLPSSVFLDLMGIPQSELAPFLRFKSNVLPSSKHMPTFEEMMKANEECDDWFGTEFDRRRATGDAADDLIGWLLEVEVDGRPITRDELLGICKMLMIAGLDTVGGSMACMLAWFARHPEQRDRVVSHPELWSNAIEELLRWESPVQGQGGFATADIQLPSGGMLPKGTMAMVYISAANLDPEVFDDPLAVRLDRHPNPHIAFASGFHRCLGTHLARMELRAGLDQFHKRIPTYRIPEGVELTYWGAVRAPRPLPIEWP